ncbi:MAG: hypothetical protein V5A38_12010 [Halolamina sp.]|uniref:hypothetical protein n=1 Tax=Halolamina sp. TaxID=1940283 RepID=UPI002FC2A17E
MAMVDGHDTSARTAKFDGEPAGHGDSGGGVPATVYGDVSADANNGLLVIIASGEHGRWSFNIALQRGNVEITRPYDEGMRIDVDELPTWMAPVRREIEALVLGER